MKTKTIGYLLVSRPLHFVRSPSTMVRMGLAVW
jgi:hypothetical protein